VKAFPRYVFLLQAIVLHTSDKMKDQSQGSAQHTGKFSRIIDLATKEVMEEDSCIDEQEGGTVVLSCLEILLNLSK